MYTLSFFIEKALKILTTNSCFFCDQGNESLCVPCIALLRKENGGKDPCHSIFLSYKDTKVKNILRLAKYEHRTSLYTPLVISWLQENTLSLLLSKDTQNTILIGMPMHRRRRIFRGYNHTEKIVAVFSRETGIRTDRTLLKKKIYTKRQALLPRTKRLVAQKGSFEIGSGAERKLLGKRIILVDDIMTTGSTFQEAKKKLLLSGAREVLCIALAH
jgi:ComF family protein